MYVENKAEGKTNAKKTRQSGQDRTDAKKTIRCVFWWTEFERASAIRLSRRGKHTEATTMTSLLSSSERVVECRIRSMSSLIWTTFHDGDDASGGRKVEVRHGVHTDNGRVRGEGSRFVSYCKVKLNTHRCHAKYYWYIVGDGVAWATKVLRIP